MYEMPQTSARRVLSTVLAHHIPLFLIEGARTNSDKADKGTMEYEGPPTPTVLLTLERGYAPGINLCTWY